MKEILQGKATDLAARIEQEKEESKLQMEMMKEVVASERQRREEVVERLKEDQEVQERLLKERMERLENESRDFFGKMEGFLDGEVKRVQDDVEIFRKQLMTESEKVAELVRKEIEARFSSDV